jgi:hypothetical protein
MSLTLDSRRPRLPAVPLPCYLGGRGSTMVEVLTLARYSRLVGRIDLLLVARHVAETVIGNEIHFS